MRQESLRFLGPVLIPQSLENSPETTHLKRQFQFMMRSLAIKALKPKKVRTLQRKR